ncbi:hypothetical protein BD626DRAFT_381485, partial [Schizophyllum amplum]
ALDIPEILQQILASEVLSRRDHSSATLVSRTWHPSATEALWRSLPSLEPLLSLLPSNAYSWTSQKRRAYGRKTLKLGLELYLTDALCSIVVERSRMIRFLTLSYDRHMVEMCIRDTIASRVNTPTVSFLSGVHTIFIKTPWDFFHPDDTVYLPRSLGRGSEVRAYPDANSLVNLLPHVSTVFVGGSALVPPTYLRTLHIQGLPLEAIVKLVMARSLWLVDELCVELDEMSDASKMAILLVTMTQACNHIHRLYIRIHEFRDNEPWAVTSGVFQLLTLLPELIDLHIEAPLRSQLSDDDWEVAARNWPFLESLRVIPGSDFAWRYNLPLVTGATPACTANAVACIARACPRLHTLVLPGINCRTLPSLEQIQSTATYGAQRSWSESPLRELGIYDSPLVNPGALGGFLRLLFPNLKEVTYTQFPRIRLADSDD